MKKIIMLLLVAVYLYAQTPTATITGSVKDPSGAVVAGAKVTVRNLGTNIGHAVITNKDGVYTVPLLEVGQYEVSAEMQGFSKSVQTGVTLEVDQTARIDFNLALGKVSDILEVTAQAPLTQTDSATVGSVVDNRHVVEMPLNGRQFYSLAALVPSVTPPVQNSTLSFRGGFNVAGSSEISNNFTLNGFNNNDATVSAPNFRPSIDAIQEFKLLTGVYPAEYGSGSGGQVVVTTKAGTNQFHGSLFEFLRNADVDARNYFLTPSLPTPAFKRNQFGGTVGGPIIKDRTFFFFSYEGLRLRQDIEQRTTVPLPAYLNGDFSSFPRQIYDPATLTAANTEVPFAGNKIPQSRLNTIGKALLGYYPAPTLPTAAGVAPANNYLFSQIRRETMNEYSLRLDHTFNVRDTLRATLNYFDDPSYEPSNNLCGARVLPGFGCFTNQTSSVYGVTETHVFTPSLVNEFRVGMNRLIQPRTMEDISIPFVQTYNIPAYADGPNNGGVPATAITSYATLGNATNLPQKRWDTTYILGDSAVWTAGKHTVKFGVDASNFRSSQYYVQYGVGSFTFNDNTITRNAAGLGVLGGTYPSSGSGLADVLLGYPAQTQSVPSAPTWKINTTAVALFAQDDYKLRSNLTVNLGLRWEVYTPVTEQRNRMATFDPSTGAMKLAGQNGVGNELYQTNYHNFAPRLGFSWQPFGDSKTVIKGGAGIFYNPQTAGNGILALFYNPPIRQPVTFISTKAKPLTLTPQSSNGFPQNSGVVSLAPTGIAQDYYTATIDEWSIGVQRQLTNSLVLDVSYFGSKGTHLPLNRNINQPRPSGLAGVTLPRPYAGFNNITYIESVGLSSYNSLQAKLEKRYSAGLTFMASFTYGHSIDDGNGVATSTLASNTNAQNALNQREGERGRSDFDVRYRFVLSPVYELPFGRGKPFLQQGIASKILGGWQVSALLSAQTGTPLTAYYSSNVSGTLNNQDRPNVVGVANSGPQTPQQWFNTAAFARPPSGTFGNAGRNIINGPGLLNLDLSLVRSFRIMERFNLQFRGQAYNSLNHPNFNYPNATADSASFGQITSAADPRQLEIAVRLLF